jgi:hypothetical protein
MSEASETADLWYFDTASHTIGCKTSASVLLGDRGLLSRNPLLPPVRRGNVVVGRLLLARAAVEVLPISTAWHSVIVPEQAALPQFGQQQLRDLLERLGEEDVCLELSACVTDYSLTQPLTKLKPSTSASSIHVSRLLATCSAVPTRMGPLPPKLTCSAIVCFVHFDVPGENLA